MNYLKAHAISGNMLCLVFSSLMIFIIMPLNAKCTGVLLLNRLKGFFYYHILPRLKAEEN